MYSTCLHCHHRLGRNDVIEHFPIGRRLAFDAAKGRLWAVCPHCARWNLTPIEERWEAVEDAERLFRSTRLRAQTDNIGLVRLAEGTDLIRIGAPLRPELAAWRYGAVFRRRRYRRIALASVGAAAVGGIGALGLGAAAATALPFAALPAVLSIGINLLTASLAARNNLVATKVVGTDGKVLHVVRTDLDHTRLNADDSTLRLWLKHRGGHAELDGDRARRALATLLAPINRGGGSMSTVGDAAALIATAGDAARAIQTVAREAERRTGAFEERSAAFARGPRGRTLTEAVQSNMTMKQQRRGLWEQSNLPPTNPGALHRLPRVHRLALEMSLHESSEELALDDELVTLERDWREAEEIAAIADGILTRV